METSIFLVFVSVKVKLSKINQLPCLNNYSECEFNITDVKFKCVNSLTNYLSIYHKVDG